MYIVCKNWDHLAGFSTFFPKQHSHACQTTRLYLKEVDRWWSIHSGVSYQVDICSSGQHQRWSQNTRLIWLCQLKIPGFNHQKQTIAYPHFVFDFISLNTVCIVTIKGAIYCSTDSLGSPSVLGYLLVCRNLCNMFQKKGWLLYSSYYQIPLIEWNIEYFIIFILFTSLHLLSRGDNHTNVLRLCQIVFLNIC